MNYSDLKENVVYQLEDLLSDHMPTNDAISTVAVVFGITSAVVRDMYTAYRGIHPEDFVQNEVEALHD